MRVVVDGIACGFVLGQVHPEEPRAFDAAGTRQRSDRRQQRREGESSYAHLSHQRVVPAFLILLVSMPKALLSSSADCVPNAGCALRASAYVVGTKKRSPTELFLPEPW